MNDPYYNGRIIIFLRLPGQTEEIRTAIDLDPDCFQSFRPLPKCREIDPRDEAVARNQAAERRGLARDLADSLTAAILEAVESNDMVNGYTKEEDREFYSPPAGYGVVPPEYGIRRP